MDPNLNHIHIVAFDLPFPPNYGGAIDMFYKIKALHDLGCEITLHVFLYDGKEAQPQLQTLCKAVHYYKRKRLKNPFTGDLPYIVSTRDDAQLLAHLCADKSPILFEGLHSTFFLNHPKLKHRIKWVRAHNVEHNYYAALEQAETSFFKKYFFRIESERLRKYESHLKYASGIAAISPMETRYFESKYPMTRYLPAFHPNAQVMGKTGQGDVVLYHGNLGVPENNQAALYLAHEVFPHLNMPCVIAGNQPSSQLQKAVAALPHVTLKANVDANALLHMVEQAHVNVLATFQNTGIKLKLLNALFRGRFCVANLAMVAETGLDTLCAVGDSPQAMVAAIQACWQKPFAPSDLQARKQILDANFNNLHNAKIWWEAVRTAQTA